MKKLIFLLSIMISFSCANPTENVSVVDADAVVADIVKISNDFQSAYISQDWETASQWISEELGTTIFNSNGSALAVGRTLVAIIENFYDGKNAIHVPKCLQKYLNKEVISCK